MNKGVRVQRFYAFYWIHIIMIDKKFKVGDKVRIIDCRSIEPYELNKIGTIVEINDDNPGWITFVVDMGRPRRSPDDGETRWWLRDKKIELASRPNEQLLFDFMS